MALMKIELVGQMQIGLVERNPRHFQIEFVHVSGAEAHHNLNRLRLALMSNQPFDLEFRPQTLLGAGVKLGPPKGH